MIIHRMNYYKIFKRTKIHILNVFTIIKEKYLKDRYAKPIVYVIQTVYMRERHSP